MSLTEIISCRLKLTLRLIEGSPSEPQMLEAARLLRSSQAKWRPKVFSQLECPVKIMIHLSLRVVFQITINCYQTELTNQV
jgi:hypothetical protein